MFYKKLTWDSNVFGYMVGAIDSHFEVNALKHILNMAKINKYKLLYLHIDPLDAARNHAALTRGGKLIDQKITFLKDINSNDLSKSSDRHITSFSEKKANNDLISLALQSGVYSRFFRDQQFVKNEYSKLYTAWINKSVNRTIAFDVLVYKENKFKIMGFITLGKNENDGNIGLIAVDTAYRSRSIGTTLMKSAIIKFKEHGFSKVYVSTQKDNAIGHQFYSSLGFRKVKESNVYHFWL